MKIRPKEQDHMNKVYYSTVIDHPAERVWNVIRDFNSYPVWVEGIDESHIEGGKSGDAVGAIRNFSTGNTRVRQRLLAHSDLDRSTKKLRRPCGFRLRSRAL